MISPHTSVNKIEFVKREVDINLSNNDCKWGAWVHAIFPIKEGVWFARDNEALNLNILPASYGGLYEMAVEHPIKAGHLSCVYVGRAQKVNKNVKGATLRTRIRGNYALNGSHKANDIRPFLEKGFHVWFRWCVLTTVGECTSKEVELIKKYDYALNTIDSVCPYRDATKVIYVDKDTNVCTYLFDTLVSDLQPGEGEDPEEGKNDEEINKRLSDITFANNEMLYLKLTKVLKRSECTISVKKILLLHIHEFIEDILKD